MKFINKTQSLENYIRLTILILLFNNYFSFKVGFFTSNLASFRFIEKDYQIIHSSFRDIADKYPSIPVLDEKDLIASQSVDDINKFDVLLLAGQEAGILYKNDFFINMLNNNVWVCSQLLKKTGATSHFLSDFLVSTTVQVCYKKSLFDLTIIRDGIRNKEKILTTKDTVGVCLKRLKDDPTQYCFFSAHFETSLTKSVRETMNAFYYKLNKRIGEYNAKQQITDDGQNFIAYIVGDLNTRIWYEVNDQESLKNVLNHNLNTAYVKTGKTDIDKSLESQLKTSDESATSYFEKEISKTYEKYTFSFCGNNFIRRVPFTYKYSSPKNKVTGLINLDDFDLKEILKEKDGTDVKKVNNFGWLDRLGCTYNKNKNQSCRIKGGIEEVRYYALPHVRKGDHMPIVGVFEVENKSSKKLK